MQHIAFFGLWWLLHVCSHAVNTMQSLFYINVFAATS